MSIIVYAVVAFVLAAGGIVYLKYRHTDPSQSAPARLWTAVTVAAAAAGVAAHALFGGGGQ